MGNSVASTWRDRRRIPDSVCSVDMADTVFILGAGASVGSGAPVMSNFFDRMEDLVYQHTSPNRLVEIRTAWETLQKARYALQRSASKAALDTDNLESVFVAFEMIRTIGEIEEFTERGITAQDAIDALTRLIAFTLIHAARITLAHGEGIKVGNDLQRFAYMLGQAGHRSGHRFDFITFNYDTLLEIALTSRNLPIRVITSSGHDLHATESTICKLHGSLDWSLLDEHIYRDEMEIDKVADIDTWNSLGRLAFERHAAKYSQTKNVKVRQIPLIVPPTDNKASHRQVMQPIWEYAKKRLQRAANIVVIGFSLPPTDEYFRTFFSVATIGNTTLRKFLIVDPSETAVNRYRSMLSPLANKRLVWMGTDGKRYLNDCVMELFEELGKD